jgi:Tfp pilus assembly protein PilX
MALFILTMLTGAGTALLFMSRHEIRVSQVGLQSKQAFYAAEAGLEEGRTLLFQGETNDDFGDELTAAAGPDGTIDFDPARLTTATTSPSGRSPRPPPAERPYPTPRS